MKYTPLLKQAWSITKKNKFLWIFGFFSVLMTGAGGDFEILIKKVSDIGDGSDWFYALQSGEATSQFITWARQAGNFFDVYGPWSLALIGLCALLFVFLLWVISAAQGALIHSVFLLKKANTATNANKAMIEGKKHAWTLFALNIFQKGLLFVLLAVVTIPLAGATRSEVEVSESTILALSSVTFLILIPLSIIVGFIVKYASTFAVLKGHRFGKALKEAWVLFRHNWVISIEMALILFVIYTFAAAVLIFILSISSVPFIVLSLASFFTPYSLTFFIIIGIYALLFIACIVLFASMLATFEFTTWTLVFDELTKGDKMSKLNRWLHPIVGGGHPVTKTKIKSVKKG